VSEARDRLAAWAREDWSDKPSAERRGFVVLNVLFLAIIWMAIANARWGPAVPTIVEAAPLLGAMSAVLYHWLVVALEGPDA
jgi:hypothetical protein